MSFTGFIFIIYLVIGILLFVKIHKNHIKEAEKAEENNENTQLGAFITGLIVAAFFWPFIYWSEVKEIIKKVNEKFFKKS